MKVKLIFILICVFIFTAVVVSLVVLKPKKPTLPAQVTPPKPVEIPKVINDKYDVSFDLGEPFDIPTSAPLLTTNQQNPYTLEEANTIAQRLGFMLSPIEFKDVKKGMTYIWKRELYSLIVYSKTREIAYKMESGIPKVPNKQLKQNDMELLTREVVEKTGLYSKDALQLSSVAYLKDTQRFEVKSLNGKENADIYQFNYTPNTVSSYKILTIVPYNSPISVWILPNGEIFQLNLHELTGLSQTPETVPLKSFDEVQMNANKAIIVSLDNDNIEFVTLPNGAITNIKINEIELFYLLDKTLGSTLQPVFLLRGKTNITGYGEVDVVLYLPAVKE